jgi:hypothetical protein
MVRAGVVGAAWRQCAMRKNALPGKAYSRRDDVLAAAQSIAAEQSLDTEWWKRRWRTRDLFSVAHLICPARLSATGHVPRAIVEARRVEAGARWWRDNDGWLALAEERWRAIRNRWIAGVETYGRNTGSFRARSMRWPRWHLTSEVDAVAAASSVPS